MAKLASKSTSKGETSGMSAQRNTRRLSEASLRKLPRTELQKLAKVSVAGVRRCSEVLMVRVRNAV
ncbi:hypothetical protein PISMIDRAFT_680388 [Pisolithus microcarpus 441]|uniref:Unplaced genomic scaffold scaffold_56, whole genome shotgun sequence n=1 Tax=Pisolithus microcarpus 441 TaxID=765257 RepID=A0A0C9YC81_9AGAM|nr:hypothetical protein PISMIDRAFT_680388 [Pisolithus microcarpus 441]